MTPHSMARRNERERAGGEGRDGGAAAAAAAADIIGRARSAVSS